ncbi:MAG: hypothetical protein ACFFDQ_13435 [Candidatus Thorarchaeota archaeon]
MKRKIPYEAWSRICAKLSNSSKPKASKSVNPFSGSSESHIKVPNPTLKKEVVVRKMSRGMSGQKHSFKVILPEKVNAHTDHELRLMLVSLKNTIVASSVHISRIENELRKRGKVSSILENARLVPLDELEIDEDFGD